MDKLLMNDNYLSTTIFNYDMEDLQIISEQYYERIKNSL